jgi:hypothetical protein
MNYKFTDAARIVANEKLSTGNPDQAYGLTQKELWGLMRDEYNNYRRMCHEDDDMTFSDFASEHVGTTYWGARVHQDIMGDVYFQLPGENGDFVELNINRYGTY